MFQSVFKLAAAISFLSLVQAAPTPVLQNATSDLVLEKRGFDCSAPVSGLSQADCQWMSNIGMAGQGANPRSNNGLIWIGTDGPNTFTFTNRATNPKPVPVTLILWRFVPGDYESLFMNKRSPVISYSLPNTGDSVTISLANGISGGFSQLTNHETILSQWGQVYNTWGEFTTGDYATFDVSREVNMGGNVLSIKSSTGCLSDMNTCVFKCKSGNTCGDPGTYSLENCQPGSQFGATYGLYDGNPSGGCQGWSNGGHLDVTLGQW